MQVAIAVKRDFMGVKRPVFSFTHATAPFFASRLHFSIDNIELHALIIVAEIPSEQGAAPGIGGFCRGGDAEAQVAFGGQLQALYALGGNHAPVQVSAPPSFMTSSFSRPYWSSITLPPRCPPMTASGFAAPAPWQGWRRQSPS